MFKSSKGSSVSDELNKININLTTINYTLSNINANIDEMSNIIENSNDGTNDYLKKVVILLSGITVVSVINSCASVYYVAKYLTN